MILMDNTISVSGITALKFPGGVLSGSDIQRFAEIFRMTHVEEVSVYHTNSGLVLFGGNCPDIANLEREVAGAPFSYKYSREECGHYGSFNYPSELPSSSNAPSQDGLNLHALKLLFPDLSEIMYSKEHMNMTPDKIFWEHYTNPDRINFAVIGCKFSYAGGNKSAHFIIGSKKHTYKRISS